MHQKIFVSINDQNLDTIPADSIKVAQCSSCNIIFQINTTSPKKKHNPKRGVGGKGPKTEFMERQLKIFKQFLAAFNYSGDVKKLNALATQCWYKNKPKWDAAAKSTGQLKGFSSAIILANAYRRINYTT